MELFGHCIALYAAAIKDGGMSHEKALEMLEEHSAKLCLTDAIRCYVTGDNVVKFGRGYSHFTDGCGMTLPFGEALKGFSSIEQTEYVHGEGYISKFADESTDFALFCRMNPEMFAPGNEDWGICVLSHLHQDVNSDTVWQYDVSICDTKNDIVRYPYTEKIVNGEQFRKDMALANIYIHRMFVEYVWNILEKELHEEEFLGRIGASFDRWYNEKMSANTKKYIDMDKRVFGATPEEMKELAKQIVATGMFANRKHLDYTAITLFQNAMVSLNPVINHMIRMQKA